MNKNIIFSMAKKEKKTKEEDGLLEELEELVIDELRISENYLQYVILQMNEGLRNNFTKIIVGSEYEGSTRVEFIIGEEQYAPFLNLLYEQAVESGYYSYLIIITDLLERVGKLENIKLTIN